MKARGPACDGDTSDWGVCVLNRRFNSPISLFERPFKPALWRRSTGECSSDTSKRRSRGDESPDMGDVGRCRLRGLSLSPLWGSSGSSLRIDRRERGERLGVAVRCGVYSTPADVAIAAAEATPLFREALAAWTACATEMFIGDDRGVVDICRSEARRPVPLLPPHPPPAPAPSCCTTWRDSRGIPSIPVVPFSCFSCCSRGENGAIASVWDTASVCVCVCVRVCVCVCVCVCACECGWALGECVRASAGAGAAGRVWCRSTRHRKTEGG